MIRDIPHHTLTTTGPDLLAPDKNSFILPTEKAVFFFFHIRNGKQIFIFPRFRDLEKVSRSLYNKSIFICFLSMISVFYLIPELDTTLLQITNSRIRNLQTARPQHLAFTGSYRTSAPVNMKAPVLRLLARKPILHGQRTYDGMPFLRQSGVPVLCPAVIVGITKRR